MVKPLETTALKHIRHLETDRGRALLTALFLGVAHKKQEQMGRKVVHMLYIIY